MWPAGRAMPRSVIDGVLESTAFTALPRGLKPSIQQQLFKLHFLVGYSNMFKKSLGTILIFLMKQKRNEDD